MSELIALINHLDSLGVTIRYQDGRLVTRAEPGAITAEVSASIRDQREALIEFLSRRESQDAAAVPPIAATTGDEHPLSYAQRRLWLVDRIGGAGASYNTPAVVMIEGELDCDAMQYVFTRIVERHRILRTRYMQRDGEPYCRVEPASAFELKHLRLEAGGSESATAALDRLIAEECACPFDLSAEFSLRVKLVNVGPHRHALIINLHHIATDGWSMEVLIRELSELYRAKLTDRYDPLPPLMVQYGDYAVWQLDWMQQGGLAGQLEYWKQRLADAPQLHCVPTDRPRPALQSYRGAVHADRLGASETRALQALCREQGATMFIALQLAFAIVLSRWSNEADIVFGTPIANRARPELEELIGFFANTLVLRNHIDGQRSFRAMLSDAVPAVARDYDHQNVPFDLIVEVLNPERSASYPPLVQIMFALQNNAGAGVTIPGLSFAPIRLPDSLAKFDLTLSVVEQAGELVTSWEYSTDLFDATTIQRMSLYYLCLLGEIGAQPDRPVAELQALDQAQRERLLGALGGVTHPYPGEGLIQRFAEQAERHAQRPALAQDGRFMSYAELDARARALADQLLAKGLGDEERVGLYFDRGMGMVIAQLAVLYAGGAYLPMEISTPGQRLSAIVADAGCRLILCDAGHRDAAALAGCEALTVDETGATCTDTVAIEAPNARGGRRLAYVMYTSGSTGAPKGVMIEQSGILRMVCNADYLMIAPEDVIAQASNAAFDASTFEIWAALLNGACLSFIDRDTLMDPPRLREVLRDSRVSVMWMTTSLFNQTAHLDPTLFAGLRCLLFGGEAAEAQSVERVVRAGKPRQLINIYGPTENTAFTTAYEVGDTVAQTVPIGRPIDNTRCYVLGRGGELLPFGAIGELHVGGAGVARGYLNRLELNREKFQPDPYDASGNGQLYRTGDLVRWLPSGDLQYLARIDHQIKMRGFRIELGEIEQALATLGEVSEAIVVVHTDPCRGKHLVAYVVAGRATAGAPATAEAFKAALAQRLPPYMVPSAIVLLEAMPLNSNGKADRSRLPEPDLDRAEAADASEPADELERAVAKVWADSLGLQRVDADTSFFDLGGNSLLVMRLCSRLHESLGLAMPFAEFFTHATVRRQAQWLRERDAVSQPTERDNRIEPQPDAADYPLSYAQQRLWFESLLGNDAGYSLPMALRLNGVLDALALAAALRDLVERHEMLRSRYLNVAGVGRQRIEPLGDWHLDRVDLGKHADAWRVCETALADELAAGFDLECGPVFKAVLYRLSGREHILLLNMHHIVCDGWSTQLLFEDLSSLYQRHSTGAASSLAPLPIRYVDYASWQRRGGDDEAMREGLAFWTRKLEFVRNQELMPTETERYAAPSYPLGERSFVVPADTVESVKRFAVVHDASLFMALSAAYGLVIADYAGYQQVVIGTDVAGRECAETQSLVGLFVHQLAIVAEVDESMDAAGLLRRVRDNTVAAYRHQHVSIERIVAALGLQRGLSQHPLFQTKLVLQNFSASTRKIEQTELQGLELQPIALSVKHSKLDLMLTLSESEEGLRADWEFNASYFGSATIRSLESAFLTVLEHIAAQPDISVRGLRKALHLLRQESLSELRGRLAGTQRMRRPVRTTLTLKGNKS